MNDCTPENSTDPKVSQSRRKLLAGLSASPILISLSSRPVLGAQNCAPSGFMSGNLSASNIQSNCGGYSPDYWKSNHRWPSPYIAGTCRVVNGQYRCHEKVNPDGTKMKDVFQNPRFKNKTLLQVLWKKQGSLEFHIIAALLNSVAPLASYAITESEVISIYNQFRTQGYYMTSNNVRMFKPDIRRFIQNTYH